MLCHSIGREVIFVSLQHFIAPALDLIPCWQVQGMRDCNKGIKFQKGAINHLWYEKENFFPNTYVWHICMITVKSAYHMGHEQ